MKNRVKMLLSEKQVGERMKVFDGATAVAVVAAAVFVVVVGGK